MRTSQSWDRDSLSVAPGRAAGWPLREEALERDFGKYHELGAIARHTLESRKPRLTLSALSEPADCWMSASFTRLS